MSGVCRWHLSRKGSVVADMAVAALKLGEALA